MPHAVSLNGATVDKTMIDEHYADSALAFLKEIYLRKGTEAAVEAAMTSAGAARIAHESGAAEARRILQAVVSAQS
jgi:hypothetical protein